MGGIIIAIVVFVILSIFMFMVFRKVILWYWKVNEAMDLLRSIDASFKLLPAVRDRQA